jgi:hypothetical protein
MLTTLLVERIDCGFCPDSPSSSLPGKVHTLPAFTMQSLDCRHRRPSGLFYALISSELDPGENLFRAEKAVVCDLAISCIVFGRVETSPASVSQAKLAFGPKRNLASITPKPLFSSVYQSSFPSNEPVVDLAMPPASGSKRGTVRKNGGVKVLQGWSGSRLQTNDASHAVSGSVGDAR